MTSASSSTSGYTPRPYTPADEASWLRCRVLSFLATAYYDDVLTTKPAVPAPGFDLVAVDGAGAVAALMDTTFDDTGALATIDSVAVHPDHQRRGLGRLLLDETRRRARAAGATTLDAWTRDTPDTLAWYRAVGFTESDHYLHVYADHYTDPAEPVRAVTERRADLRPVRLFMHAPLAEEKALREQFVRVHVCRRCSMTL